MDPIKQHFEEEAQDFDRIILTLIPDYLQMLNALVAAIPFDSTAVVRVVDLGCGTGTVAQRVLQAFPNAQVTCLDVAENMVTMAQTKLAQYPHVRWLVGDFDAFDADGKYDAVVSSLALHHLVTDDDKRRFYRRIYNALDPGGVFYNADVVLGSNDFLQAVYMREWRTFMRGGVSDTEIEGKWIPKYHAEDRPAKLVEQLSWLAEVGFVDVDVLWKHYNVAVYGGGVKR
jgi:tRNA (cmo5U34)-methyltransferase